MKVKEFIELYHDKYYEYYIAIYIWGHHDNFAPDYIGEFSHKIEYIKYWDCEIESVNQTSTRINLFLAFSEKKDTKLIKIKINDKDRETLASMLDYAVSLANEKLHESYSSEDADYFIKLEKKFKDLRNRIVYEELKNETEDVG